MSDSQNGKIRNKNMTIITARIRKGFSRGGEQVWEGCLRGLCFTQGHPLSNKQGGAPFDFFSEAGDVLFNCREEMAKQTAHIQTLPAMLLEDFI